MLQVLYHLLVACAPCMYLVYLQCLRPSTSLCNRHYMVLTLDLFRMESSFTTASCQRGEPLLLHVHTLQCTLIYFTSLLVCASFSCSSCTSRFNCNWCPVEFQCRTSGADCSQSPVVSVHAALIQCHILCTLEHQQDPFLTIYPSTSSVHLCILSPSPACLD